MSNTSCQSAEVNACRDDSAALALKLIAIASILLAGVVGIAIPLIGKQRRFLRTDGSLFVAAKAFAAGVILAPVLFTCSRYYERKQGLNRASEEQARVGSVDVAHHRDSHPHGQDACDGHVKDHGHGHNHRFSEGDEESGARHVAVSQILELGVVSHSVIIGLSLGVSQSPCTIRPLIAALSFHQFFEGFALGGCISQAQFKTLSATIMACFFAITTPAGIGIGTGISSFYNPHSSAALIAEGILDSSSAGILVYMALVDLIAADFLSKSMSCNFRLQLVSYFMLFLGAGMMAALAIWV
ncbi:hypothetical protein GH714_036962 [Hevea brasiliensis]|uniref:Uncharacterized protein n=1 Tax=Hevea brasiliensis TaxID=3981 RepID=A0A6A6KDS7_HEVBR|nr:hypothetical protein GH714_036962 [Hevea brasiliensis]